MLQGDSERHQLRQPPAPSITAEEREKIVHATLERGSKAMSVSNVSLTTGTNNNLLALTKTSNGLNQTLQSLASGQNNQVTDSVNFSAAQDLISRISNLSASKDNITNSITTGNIAQAGYQGVSSVLQSAQGIASAAQSSANPAEQASYAATYKTMISQANQIANDAGIGSNISPSLPSSTLSTTSSSELESSMSSVRSQSAASANNLGSSSIIQDFTNNMINTLQTGAGNLTLSDMNQQAANALMQQTQQNLGIAALSISSKSAQSVLRLFGTTT